ALSIVTQRRRRGIDVIATNCCDVFQMDELSAIAPRGSDEEVFEILDPIPFPGGINCNRKWADIGRSAVDHEILLLEQGKDLFRANPKLGHPIASQVNINDFLLVAKKFDFLHVTHEEQFATDQLGRFIKLRVGIVRTRKCIKNSKDIAEVV